MRQQNKHTDLKYRVNQRKSKTKSRKLDKFERLRDSDKGLPSSQLTTVIPPLIQILFFVQTVTFASLNRRPTLYDSTLPSVVGM